MNRVSKYLKGLIKPDEGGIRDVLNSYKLVEGDEVESLLIRKVSNQDWVFITYTEQRRVSGINTI